MPCPRNVGQRHNGRYAIRSTHSSGWVADAISNKSSSSGERGSDCDTTKTPALRVALMSSAEQRGMVFLSDEYSSLLRCERKDLEVG
jgi:hypothetical protein